MRSMHHNIFDAAVCTQEVSYERITTSSDSGDVSTRQKYRLYMHFHHLRLIKNQQIDSKNVVLAMQSVQS